MEINVALALALLLLGFFIAFFGFKLFNLTLGAITFIIGAAIGYWFVRTYIPPSSDIGTIALRLMIPVIAGLIFVVISFFIYKVGISIIVGFALYSFITSILGFTVLNESEKLILAVVLTVVIVLFIILTGIFDLPIIISSAFTGANFIVSSIFFLLLNYSTDDFIKILVDKSFVINQLSGDRMLIYMGSLIFLFVVSVLYQVGHRRSTRVHSNSY